MTTAMTPASRVHSFRKVLAWTSAIAAALWIVLTVGAHLLGGSFGLLIGVAATISLVTAGASFVAWLLLPGYATDIAGLGRMGEARHYIVRSTTWGIAATAAGVLLAEALPRGLSGPVAVDARSLTVQGTVVVAFGIGGAALGILEEWRHRAGAEGEVARMHHPEAVTSPVAHEPEVTVINTDPSLKAIDRWVLGASVVVAIALITASVLRPENTNVYFSATWRAGGDRHRLLRLRPIVRARDRHARQTELSQFVHATP